MPRMYLSLKDAILAVIHKHFPPLIADRFSVRMESEIWKPSEDEGVWNRNKAGREIAHILFDMVDIFEIPPQLPKVELERYILFAFKWSIEDGKISVEKKPEFTDNKTAKKNRLNKRAKAKKDFKKVFDQVKEQVNH